MGIPFGNLSDHVLNSSPTFTFFCFVLFCLGRSVISWKIISCLFGFAEYFTFSTKHIIYFHLLPCHSFCFPTNVCIWLAFAILWAWFHKNVWRKIWHEYPFENVWMHFGSRRSRSLGPHTTSYWPQLKHLYAINNISHKCLLAWNDKVMTFHIHVLKVTGQLYCDILKFCKTTFLKIIECKTHHKRKLWPHLISCWTLK